jgi:hypothetical protein
MIIMMLGIYHQTIYECIFLQSQIIPCQLNGNTSLGMSRGRCPCLAYLRCLQTMPYDDCRLHLRSWQSYISRHNLAIPHLELINIQYLHREHILYSGQDLGVPPSASMHSYRCGHLNYAPTTKPSHPPAMELPLLEAMKLGPDASYMNWLAVNPTQFSVPRGVDRRFVQGKTSAEQLRECGVPMPLSLNSVYINFNVLQSLHITHSGRPIRDGWVELSRLLK